VILLNIGCDQITKSYARDHFRGRGTIPLLGDFVIVHYAENAGGFLSLGSDIPQPYKNVVLLFFPIVLIVASLIFIVKNSALSFFEIVLICSIVGGGISNIFDRIYYHGKVTDFLNFGIGPLRTGILNFADMSIFFGVILLFIVQYRNEKKKTAVEESRDQ